MLNRPDEPKSFYIGWMPKAAPEYRGFIRLVIFALVVVCVFVAALLVSNQRGFSSGIYERNNFTELEGLLIQKPFPAIKTFFGKDIYGNPVEKTILLVNKGKFGADSLVALMIAQHKTSDENLWVKVKGRLIYNHGTALMELTDEDASMHEMEASPKDEKISDSKMIEMDSVTLHGQIIDPKCYLGVMKPGEGKPHSDCAIRCISGGIPPMLRIKNDQGEETFFILRGENGEIINKQVLSYVGIPVSVTGMVEQVDDWYVLKVNPASGIIAEN